MYKAENVYENSALFRTVKIRIGILHIHSLPTTIINLWGERVLSSVMSRDVIASPNRT
jgi:hypothetical protein